MQETKKQTIRYKRVELTDLCRKLSREEIQQRIDHLLIRLTPSAGERRKARLFPMTAKFVSKCFQCGHQISRGADILLDRSTGRARHAECPPLH
jgi:hypothetical protein